MKIEDIPTEQFQRIMKTLVSNGWQCIYEFDGVIAWVDYGEVHLKNGNNLVKFVWDNWTEGEITADREIEEVRALL
ncbi:hypothetical protein IAD21_01747 [Abditibacteriota bacterium]|nr:hypothetical protein IAD21_01747 [Abditibacteriota bacterium]